MISGRKKRRHAPCLPKSPKGAIPHPHPSDGSENAPGYDSARTKMQRDDKKIYNTDIIIV